MSLNCFYFKYSVDEICTAGLLTPRGLVHLCRTRSGFLCNYQLCRGIWGEVRNRERERGTGKRVVRVSFSEVGRLLRRRLREINGLWRGRVRRQWVRRSVLQQQNTDRTRVESGKREHEGNPTSRKTSKRVRTEGHQ